MTIAGAAHVVSWIAQFMGHGLAEGRAPALLDNLLGGDFYLFHVLFKSDPIYKPSFWHHSLCTWKFYFTWAIGPQCTRN